MCVCERERETERQRDRERERQRQRDRERESLKLCLTLCNPMDCNPPGSSVLEILQARLLEWVAMHSSRESFQPRDLNLRLLRLRHHWWILYH